MIYDFDPRSRSTADFYIPVSAGSRILRSLATVAVTYTYGIDLSHWQAQVDFPALKADGIEYVILKATEGDYYTDETWDERWRAALDAGLVVMAYHFWRSQLDGTAQARYFHNAVADFLAATNGNTYLAYDVETTDGATMTYRRTQLKIALEYSAARVRRTGCYSSPSLWTKLIGTVSWIASYTNWVAHWTSAASPTLPPGWTSQTTPLWQYGIYPTYSWTRPVQGVSTPIDVNRFFGTIDDLKQLLNWSYAPALTLEQKVDRLWVAHPELHY